MNSSISQLFVAGIIVCCIGYFHSTTKANLEKPQDAKDSLFVKDNNQKNKNQ